MVLACGMINRAWRTFDWRATISSNSCQGHCALQVCGAPVGGVLSKIRSRVLAPDHGAPVSCFSCRRSRGLVNAYIHTSAVINHARSPFPKECWQRPRPGKTAPGIESPSGFLHSLHRSLRRVNEPSLMSF